MMNLSIVLAFSSRIQNVKMLSMEMMMTQAIPVTAQAVHQAQVVVEIAKTLNH